MDFAASGKQCHGLTRPTFHLPLFVANFVLKRRPVGSLSIEKTRHNASQRVAWRLGRPVVRHIFHWSLSLALVFLPDILKVVHDHLSPPAPSAPGPAPPPSPAGAAAALGNLIALATGVSVALYITAVRHAALHR